MNPSHKLFALTICNGMCISSLSLFAQNQTQPQPQDTPVTTLPIVTVTAGSPTPTLPSLEEARELAQRTPGNIAVVDATEIRGGRASTMEDIFANTPGIYSSARGSIGNEVKLSIRGSGLDLGYHLRGIKLLQDGIPVSLADGFGDFQAIDPLSINYVEVWRGSNALRYGATTLGGAINFVSPTGHTADLFRFRAEAGSYDYYNAQISSGGVEGAWDYYASFSYMFREGFQDHGRLESQRFFANVGYQINDDVQTRFFITYIRSLSALPGNLTLDEIDRNPRLSAPDSVAFDQRRDIDWFRIANRTSFQIDDDQRLETSLYYTYFLLDHPLFWNPYYLNALGVRDSTYHSFGGEIRYVNDGDLFGRENHFTIGFVPGATLIHDERFVNDRGSHGPQVADGHITAVNYDLYFENQHRLTDKLSIVAGTSFTYAVRNFDDDFVSDPNGDQSRDQDYYGFSPKLGLIYDLDESSQIFTNVSRSFEPPTSLEIVGLGGVAGNVLTRGLDAQSATTFEIGTRGEHDWFRWELAYYYSWIENELLTINDSNGNPLGTINGPETHHQGIELGLDIVLLDTSSNGPANVTTSTKSAKDIQPATQAPVIPGNKLTLKQIFNWNDFRFDNSDTYGDNQLAGAPEFYYRAELLFEAANGLYFGPNVQWVSRLPVDYANTLYADGYAILGLRVGYRSEKGWSVFAEARNLTDEHYASSAEPLPDAGGNRSATRAFHPGSPISFFGGFEYKF